MCRSYQHRKLKLLCRNQWRKNLDFPQRRQISRQIFIRFFKVSIRADASSNLNCEVKIVWAQSRGLISTIKFTRNRNVRAIIRVFSKILGRNNFCYCFRHDSWPAENIFFCKPFIIFPEISNRKKETFEDNLWWRHRGSQIFWEVQWRWHLLLTILLLPGLIYVRHVSNRNRKPSWCFCFRGAAIYLTVVELMKKVRIFFREITNLTVFLVFNKLTIFSSICGKLKLFFRHILYSFWRISVKSF